MEPCGNAFFRSGKAVEWMEKVSDAHPSAFAPCQTENAQLSLLCLERSLHMSRRFWMVLGIGVSCVLACGEPAGLPTAGVRSLTVPSAASSAVVKQAIAGTLSFVGGGPLAGFRMTPSGRCFFLNAQVFDHFEGDVVGPVTFYEDQRAPCDFSRLTGSGPFVAQVTWNGLTGTIAGQWTTNCKADASQPIGLSCDGTMNARGSDEGSTASSSTSAGPGLVSVPLARNSVRAVRHPQRERRTCYSPRSPLPLLADLTTIPAQ